ncbi:hypothetical protein V8G54_008781 [Vigna mungo]|uniref:Uncharacterized protein n=1 Tax=Vigna mungo TaxID=3915 RepID=A0AAQ3S6T6_VIGMU
MSPNSRYRILSRRGQRIFSITIHLSQKFHKHKGEYLRSIACFRKNTLSHFDFLFCLPSRESAVGGTKGKPLAVTAEAPATGMAILGALATIPGCVPPAINSTFCAFFFSCSFLSLSRLISASALL